MWPSASPTRTAASPERSGPGSPSAQGNPEAGKWPRCRQQILKMPLTSWRRWHTLCLALPRQSHQSCNPRTPRAFPSSSHNQQACSPHNLFLCFVANFRPLMASLELSVSLPAESVVCRFTSVRVFPCQHGSKEGESSKGDRSVCGCADAVSGQGCVTCSPVRSGPWGRMLTELMAGTIGSHWRALGRLAESSSPGLGHVELTLRPFLSSPCCLRPTGLCLSSGRVSYISSSGC